MLTNIYVKEKLAVFCASFIGHSYFFFFMLQSLVNLVMYYKWHTVWNAVTYPHPLTQAIPILTDVYIHTYLYLPGNDIVCVGQSASVCMSQFFKQWSFRHHIDHALLFLSVQH